MPEYIDDANGPDLVGRRIAWQIGRIAWDVAVTGRKELIAEALHHTRMNADEQLMIQNEIAGLIKRKYAEFPKFCTAIRDFSISIIDGVPRIKARPGETFPALPPSAFEEPRNGQETARELTPESILSLRKSMNLTQVKFGELIGVSSKKGVCLGT